MTGRNLDIVNTTSPVAESIQLPTLIELELTSACNAECSFCPRHLFEKPDLMKRETFLKVVERVIATPIRRVKLVGIGEPTLHRDVVWALETLRSNGISPILNTNGSRLHKVGVERVLAAADEVIVSLHTLDPEVHRQIFQVDIYDDVIRNLDALLLENQRWGRQITIYVVVTNLNGTAVEEIEARYRGKVTVRASGCTNRALGTFNDKLIDLGACDVYNHYPTITDSKPVCGFATAAVAISATGHYLVCTNDVERGSITDTVFTASIEDMCLRIREGLMSGAFLKLCSKCDNFEPYRAQFQNHQRSLRVVQG